MITAGDEILRFDLEDVKKQLLTLERQRENAEIALLEFRRGFDCVLVTFGGSATWDDANEIESSLGRHAEAALFTRSENVSISDIWNRQTFASVYGCGEKYFGIAGIERLSGRLLWDRDSTERRSFAVIDENLATILFAGNNCIGEKIIVCGREYSVVGVCTAEDGVLTSVDEYAVYLPVSAYTFPDTQSGCLLRLKDDISLTFALQRGISVPGGIKSIDDLKVRSGMWSMPARLSLLVVWIMAFVFTVKLTVKYLGKRISRAKARLDDLYLREYVKKHAGGIAIHIAALSALGFVFYLWFRAVGFTVVIDASLIPKSLIDVSEWLRKITAYMRTRNSMYAIPFAPSVKVVVCGVQATVASVIHVFSARKLFSHAGSYICDIVEEKL
jgi:hypothetical protein